MTNLKDITACTDLVVETFLLTKSASKNNDDESNNEANDNIEKMTGKERHQFAGLMGWDATTPYMQDWIWGACQAGEKETVDYEGAILARQECDPTWWV